MADVGVPSRRRKHGRRGRRRQWVVIDVLVNNAGIGGPRAALEDISYDDWDRTIGVNLNGMFYCIKNVAPHMKAQNSGCIVNISTASAKVALPMRSPYVASKVGVLGLTHTVAREYGPLRHSLQLHPARPDRQ